MPLFYLNLSNSFLSHSGEKPKTLQQPTLPNMTTFYYFSDIICLCSFPAHSAPDTLASLLFFKHRSTFQPQSLCVCITSFLRRNSHSLYLIYPSSLPSLLPTQFLFILFISARPTKMLCDHRNSCYSLLILQFKISTQS